MTNRRFRERGRLFEAAMSRISFEIEAGLPTPVVLWLADVEIECSFESIRAHPAELTIEVGGPC